MHGDEPQVKVYAFWEMGETPESNRLARFKAPREVIEEQHLGQVLEATGQLVPASELDDLGRYRRRATGWGELA